ncbi:hypothetical protein DFP83_10523 [Idiomarina fontislapidosi]|uniref:Uncharacterized protein n=1 Tax=Idiomarina fontislapidosi TaxID=263723 RepID=A0A432XYP6_9GAMM|nr:DUF6170 family protein [Idiomarina fontislapidosi]PYE32716.1 hypothetical protein DFP83_10523 [Idiomarina fontislapidosi]RUO53840.1 hypothetical protein CWE25_08095 [Idiomarina fontislapidosi]|tara:strand:+ start:8921 stop:9274 length:354 start_codon:yes stop_codon:yes gene_type:complete
MGFYLTSRQVPQLKSFPFTERALILTIAQQAMPVPRRMICNLAKLVPICIIFFAIVDLPGWWKAVGLLAAGIGYPLFTQPITLNMSLPYIDKAVRQFEAQRADQLEEEDQDEDEDTA